MSSNSKAVTYKVAVYDIDSILQRIVIKGSSNGYTINIDNDAKQPKINEEIEFEVFWPDETEEIKGIEQIKTQEIESSEVDGEENPQGGFDATADEDLGKLGENFVYELLKTQKRQTEGIFEIDHVATTRKTSPGYDFEVTTDKGIYGVEVKATRQVKNVAFHITNNEMRALSKLGSKGLIVIVVFQKDALSIDCIFVIPDFFTSCGIDNSTRKDLIATKDIGVVSFYPQVYIASIDSCAIKGYLLSGDTLIK